MAKQNWRDRMKARKVATYEGMLGWLRRSDEGDWVSARRADKVMHDLEREIIDLTSERDEARAEIERLNAVREKEFTGIRKQMSVNLSYFHSSDRDTLAILQSHIEDSLRRMEGV